MPLDSHHITAASRIALPGHVAFSTLLGLAWLLQDGGRTAVPALYALRNFWPIQSTALIILVVGVIALLGLLSSLRNVAAVALGMGALAYVILAVFVAVPLLHGDGSYSAPLWPLYVATMHVASMVSLARDGRVSA